MPSKCQDKNAVYKHQPQGFIDMQHSHHIVLFHKALYDHKQPCWQWFATLSTHLLLFGFDKAKQITIFTLLQREVYKYLLTLKFFHNFYVTITIISICETLGDSSYSNNLQTTFILITICYKYFATCRDDWL